jgi:multidrug efflux pump subunit AcrB
VLFAVPFGIFGALMAVWLRGMTNDVYFQIGMVTLIGLASKNAILIVEFASQKFHEGMSASAATLEAARLRFRPIIMTSMAFILGVLPLAISSGAGAGARRSVGTGVMGGMLAATFLAIFFVPMFFKLLTTLKLREPRSTQEIRAEAEHAQRAAHHAAHHPHHGPASSAEGEPA